MLDHLGSLTSESHRFATALAIADPAAPVPSCPEWTAADLLWHLTEVQLFWNAIVAGRLSDPDAATAARPDRPDSVEASFLLFSQASQALRGSLEAAAPTDAVWTWAPDQTVAFVRRRQAHEALIHRVDAELTAGHRTVIDPDLAADGIGEFVQYMASAPDWAQVSPAGPVGLLTATDTGATWRVQASTFSGVSPNSGRSYEGERCLAMAADGDAPAYTVSGKAANLDTWLWNRPQLGDVTFEGDTAALEQLRVIVADGVQ